MPMRPYLTEMNGKPVAFACIHWRTFPPVAVLEGHTPEMLRSTGVVSETDYQRIKTWERVCGLVAMDDVTCRTCPHVRWVDKHPVRPPALVTLDGKGRVPILDKPFLAALPRNRGNLMVSHRPPGTRHARRDAAWVERAKEGQDEG